MLSPSPAPFQLILPTTLRGVYISQMKKMRPKEVEVTFEPWSLDPKIHPLCYPIALPPPWEGRSLLHHRHPLCRLYLETIKAVRWKSSIKTCRWIHCSANKGSLRPLPRPWKRLKQCVHEVLYLFFTICKRYFHALCLTEVPSILSTQKVHKTWICPYHEHKQQSQSPSQPFLY